MSVQGEQSFLAGATFTYVGDTIASVHETPARILGHKYPQRLPQMCEEFSTQASPTAQPFALAEALATSRLPKERRVQVLSEFAQRGSPEHQRCVLQNLAKLDGKKCADILITVLPRLPRDSYGPYEDCPAAGFTHVVMQIEDDAIWREYLRTVKRSSAGLRMAMMGPMYYGTIGDKNRGRRLAFLAAFLKDDAWGTCPDLMIAESEVRDFAAMLIASILGLEDAPDEFWTDEQWTALREKVQKALAGEDLPYLDSAK